MAILELASPVSGDVVQVTAATAGWAPATPSTTTSPAGPTLCARRRRAGRTLVLDGVGGQIGRDALELLEGAGRLVMFGSASGSLTKLSADDLFARGISAAAAYLAL